MQDPSHWSRWVSPPLYFLKHNKLYFQVGYVLHYSNFRNLNYFRFVDELLEARLAGDTHIDYTNYIVVHNHNDKLLVWTEAEVVEAEKHECFVASESHHNRQFQ